MKKPTVGQTLYSLNVGNAARGREQKLTPVVVTKIGRKYFTAIKDPDGFPIERPYRLDTWMENSNYAANEKLYETEQEWKDEKEARALSKTIGAAFECGRNKTEISLPWLRKIMAIIEEGA